MKEVWHTDIVVSGQGMNVKVVPRRGTCAKLSLMPDVPGKKADKAKRRFVKEVERAAWEIKACSPEDWKESVETAVKKTRARWNKWHRESYR